MKRMFALMIALLGGLVLLGPATPAQAATHYSITWCDGTSVVMCTRYTWRDQNDSSGVYLEAIRIEITQGCNTLENDTPVNEMMVSVWNNDETSIRERQNLSAMPTCADTTRDLELRGPDTGATKVQWQGKLRVDNGPDYRQYHTCWIRPNGVDSCNTSFGSP